MPMDEPEIINVMDENGNVLKSISREEAERLNHIIPNVLIIVFNSAGKTWVQKRALTKKHYPGLWDISACGGIGSTENPFDAAERETFEETGLKVSLQHIKTFMNIFPGDTGEVHRRLSYLYIGVSDGQPQLNEEVDEFKALDPAELREDLLKNPQLYVPSFLIELDMAREALAKL